MPQQKRMYIRYHVVLFRHENFPCHTLPLFSLLGIKHIYRAKNENTSSKSDNKTIKKEKMKSNTLEGKRAFNSNFNAFNQTVLILISFLFYPARKNRNINICYDQQSFCLRAVHKLRNALGGVH